MNCKHSFKFQAIAEQGDFQDNDNLSHINKGNKAIYGHYGPAFCNRDGVVTVPGNPNLPGCNRAISASYGTRRGVAEVGSNLGPDHNFKLWVS